MELLLGMSAKIHGKAAQEPLLVIHSTVQKKNFTYQVNSKQHGKIKLHCLKMADQHGIGLVPVINFG